METSHQPPRPRLLAVAGALLLLLLTSPAFANGILRPSPNFAAPDTARAAGAILWLHGAYDTVNDPAPPPEAPFVARFARTHWDIWRLDRTTRPDPLPGAEAALIDALHTLHAKGYHHIIVAGHSRGAFIALAALAHPDLADAVAAISPAAHGTSPDRRPQALADYMALLKAARPPMRLALVQFTGDPFDPDPKARSEAADGAGLKVLHIFEPKDPTGHMGVFEPDFDTIYGERLVKFLKGKARPGALPLDPASRAQARPTEGQGSL